MKTSLRDLQSQINAPISSDDDMQAAILLDADAVLDGETIRTLLKVRATWLGQIAPEAGNEIDDGAYTYVNGCTDGEAVAEMYDWLVQATRATTERDVSGQAKPMWVIEALNEIAGSKTLSRTINTLRLELADAAEARISGAEKEDLLAAIVGKTGAKTEADIYAALTAARQAFKALPEWAQRASYTND